MNGEGLQCPICRRVGGKIPMTCAQGSRFYGICVGIGLRLQVPCVKGRWGWEIQIPISRGGIENPWPICRVLEIPRSMCRWGR